MIARFAALSIATVISASCDGALAPPRDLVHAAVTRSCAPNDGPAVTIYLSQTPYLQINVWQPLASLGGRPWSVGSGSSEGSATFVAVSANPETATTGTVTVHSVSADNHVEGTVDVIFPKSGRIHGGFQAIWKPQTFLCG
jgi:hypothetical protein